MLTQRVASVGGVTCYRVDPDAHDDRTLATIHTLFDVVLEHRDGDWQRQ